jgi:hypothetical protein
VRLNNETPDGSVVKFAVAAISSRLKDQAAADVFQYVVNLAWYYPILLPYLEQIDARSGQYNREQLIEKLHKIIDVNVSHRRSDGICWALYYLEQLDTVPSESAIVGIIESRDCVAIAMLCNFEVAVNRVSEYAKELIDCDLYVKDQNWLLLYQLYRMDKIADPYKGEPTFDLLRKYDVDFFCSVGESSRAEQYCSLIENPFADKEKMPTFDQWMQGMEYDYAAAGQ